MTNFRSCHLIVNRKPPDDRCCRHIRDFIDAVFVHWRGISALFLKWSPSINAKNLHCSFSTTNDSTFTVSLIAYWVKAGKISLIAQCITAGKISLIAQCITAGKISLIAQCITAGKIWQVRCSVTSTYAAVEGKVEQFLQVVGVLLGRTGFRCEENRTRNSLRHGLRHVASHHPHWPGSNHCYHRQKL